MYTIKLKEFQGPLDLLLQLTEDKKLDITEISLAKITDQYLDHLKNLQDISLEDLADFLSVASRLILIKSRMILPSLKLTDDEEQDIEVLKKQLEEYKKFKDFAKQIDEIIKFGNIAYSREKYCGLNAIFYPPEKITANDLKRAFKKIMDEIAFLDKLPEESIELKISIEEKIKKIQEELLRKIKITFQDTVKKNKSKLDIIIGFLALLELVKQKLVAVNQDRIFGEITISKKA